MNTVKNYLSLIKFSHTIFALPFALIGFFLAIVALPKVPHVYYNMNFFDTNWKKTLLFLKTNWYVFLLVVLCMVFARSAAMAFNRYLDRTFDAKNPRTAVREIPSGVISANNALIFTIISCVPSDKLMT